jgi:hypothetical protein
MTRIDAVIGIGSQVKYSSVSIESRTALPSGAVVYHAIYLWKKAKKMRLAAVTRMIKMPLAISPDLTRCDTSMTSYCAPQL